MHAAMETLRRHYYTDTARIGFVRFIFEAYEGVAVVTTLDPGSGLIQLTIAPDLVADADRIIEDLKKEMTFYGAQGIGPHPDHRMPDECI